MSRLVTAYFTEISASKDSHPASLDSLPSYSRGKKR